MGNQVEIRCVSDSELPVEVRTLVDRATAEGYAWVGRLPGLCSERQFTDLGEGLFLASHECSPVGIAAVARDDGVSDPLTGRIRFVYVTPEARGLGIASALLQTCLERATEQWAILRLHTDNPVAAQLYEARGFARSEVDAGTTHILKLSRCSSLS